MFNSIKDLFNNTSDSDHDVLFNYNTGETLSLGKKFNELCGVDCKKTCFNKAFEDFNFKDLKQRVDNSLNGFVRVIIRVHGLDLPFKLSKLELENEKFILANMLVDSFFFGTFDDKFDLVRQNGFFLTAYLNQNYQIVACSRKYKEVFENSSDILIGNHIYHNILNYRPDVNIDVIADIVKKHSFWYGVAVLKIKDNIFEPFVVVSYNREIPVIDAKFEVHFFPLTYFGNATILQYDFHAGQSGIYSRTIFEAIVHKYLTLGNKDKYLLFMDINNFKSINDSYGHDYGDKVLKTLSEILSDVFGDYIISRYGGDEFAVYIEKDISKEKIIELINEVESRIHLEIGDKFKEGKTHLSFGISKYKDNGITLNELVNAADMGMYRAKRKNSFYEFCYE